MYSRSTEGGEAEENGGTDGAHQRVQGGGTDMMECLVQGHS